MKKMLYLLFVSLMVSLLGGNVAVAEEKNGAEEKLEVLNRQISFFNERLETEPDNPNWHFQLGTKYYELGRFYEERADRIFLSGENKSDINKARRLYESSVEHLEHSLRIQPDNAGAHFNLSLTHFVDGDAENAIVHMRKSEQLFMAYQDKRGVAKARKALREWFDRYGYRPEDFPPRN
ncbi:MAG: hypothetical protein NPINA01_00090 [Nitrospinaceae bacterium]|nr:MAG: hypothetical protein NPINA01_00090 [Nitrospinaceae bacterium]